MAVNKDEQFLIYNTCDKASDNQLEDHERTVDYDYQILSNIPECSETNLAILATIPCDSTNINSCSNSWMTPNATEEVQKLLNEWNFGSLFPVFSGECIDVNAMKLMTPNHLKQLGKKYNIKLGIVIKFENCLMSWQQFNISNSLPDSERNKLNEDTNELRDCEQNGLASAAKVDVEQILKLSSQGRLVLDHYNNNLKLNEGSRAVIVELITSHIIQNDIRMTVKLAEAIAEGIVKVFQTEFLGYYYLKQPGKKPQGKLYDKYFNLVRKLKKNGVLQKRPYINKSSPAVQKRVVNLDPPEVNVDMSIEAILHDNCSWANVESHWAATKNYRLNEISNAKCTSEILNKWLQYKKPLGFKLIDIDFQQLYPHANIFNDSLESFSSKIILVFEERIKDQANKLLFQNMQKMKNITQNGRFTGLFYLLHSILVPSSKMFDIKNGKKVCTRFSIRDSQKSFIIDGSTVAACEEELLKRQEAKSQIQPSILIAGSILEPQEIAVYFEGIKYGIHSVVKAIDTCFKIFFIFNLEFPRESILVWGFIQKYFYNITTNCDYDSPQINSLISNLN